MRLEEARIPVLISAPLRFALGTHEKSQARKAHHTQFNTITSRTRTNQQLTTNSLRQTDNLEVRSPLQLSNEHTCCIELRRPILTKFLYLQSRRQNECVALRNVAPRLRQLLTVEISQGNIQFRKAPQQDAHSVPSLRLVSAIPGVVDRGNMREKAIARITSTDNQIPIHHLGESVTDEILFLYLQGAALFTFRSTPAHHADTPLLRPESVRPYRSRTTGHKEPYPAIFVWCACVRVRLLRTNWEATTTDNWSEKAKRRKTVGTGRMRYLKDVSRRFKNGFQTGVPKDSHAPF